MTTAVAMITENIKQKVKERRSVLTTAVAMITENIKQKVYHTNLVAQRSRNRRKYFSLGRADLFHTSTAYTI